MDEAALAARLVLAAVFALAAVAKLADREGAREAMSGLGAPARLAPALAWAVPVAELATAALLVPGATADVGATAALILLLTFSSAIAAALARGERPDCHCLGRLRRAPAGDGALARNFGLALLAGFVLVA